MTMILKNPTFQKALDFFRPLPEETRCLGLSLGRQEASVVETVESGGKIRVLDSRSFSLPEPLWTGMPGEGNYRALVEGLKPLLQKPTGYRTLQVSLPDPAASWEVFELEKIPAAGAAMDEFLNWRFKSSAGKAQRFAFTTQIMGREYGEKLLLATALDRAWLEFTQKALEEAGARPSFLDVASRYRFNLFHDPLTVHNSGALISLERDYWTLLVWDHHALPRFQRSKWWRNPIEGLKDLPLDEVVLEVERTIRSYVHSGADRLVTSLFLTAPEAWLGVAAQAFRKAADVEVLSLRAGLGFSTLPDPDLSPSLAATAVRQ